MLLAVPADRFPVGVLTVNLVGSLLLGVYLARREPPTTRPWSLPFWAIGVIGSFTTTFSAFTFDVVRLVDAGEPVWQPPVRWFRSSEGWRAPRSANDLGG